MASSGSRGTTWMRRGIEAMRDSSRDVVRPASAFVGYSGKLVSAITYNMKMPMNIVDIVFHRAIKVVTLTFMVALIRSYSCGRCTFSVSTRCSICCNRASSCVVWSHEFDHGSIGIVGSYLPRSTVLQRWTAATLPYPIVRMSLFDGQVSFVVSDIPRPQQ